MEHITIFTVERDKKIKKFSTVPRAETMAMIRQFARVYKFESEVEPRLGNYLLN